MHIKLILIGNTNEAYLKEGIAEYFQRIKKYNSIDIIEIKDIKNAKNLSQDELKKKEGQQILQHVHSGDYVVLLDDKGKQYTSLLFADFVQAKMNVSIKQLVFIIGGAYGFSDEIYKLAKEKLSLSAMTFSHQLIRVVFLEQLYRAFSILNHSPYHHE